MWLKNLLTSSRYLASSGNSCTCLFHFVPFLGLLYWFVHIIILLPCRSICVRVMCFVGDTPRMHGGLALLQKKSNADPTSLKRTALEFEHEPLWSAGRPKAGRRKAARQAVCVAASPGTSPGKGNDWGWYGAVRLAALDNLSTLPA